MLSKNDFLRVRAIVLDIDGVLTDGRVGYGDTPVGEVKFFHVRDGHWLKLARRAGLQAGLLSGRECAANRRGAAELGLDFCIEKCHDKLAGFVQLLSSRGLAAEECMYIGDDVVDMPPMRRAGVAVAVADAVPELDEVADFRTVAPGGRGAVCEAVRRLLLEQDKLDSVLERYRA